MRISLRWLALLAIPILAAACDDSQTEPGDDPLSLETLAQTSSAGFPTPSQEVIRTEDDWTQVWETLYSGQRPQPSRPAIDFDRQMVVLAAGGPGNGCFQVEITRAMRKADGSLEVEVTNTEPGPTCVCTEQLIQPVHVVRLERVEGPERFMLRRQQLNC